jgi:glycine betaine/proline transport system permease protein
MKLNKRIYMNAVCLLIMSLLWGGTVFAQSNHYPLSGVSGLIEEAAEWMMDHLDILFTIITSSLMGIFNLIFSIITFFPKPHFEFGNWIVQIPTIIIAIIPLAYYLSGRSAVWVFLGGGLLISSFGLWNIAEQTISIALTSSLIAFFFGVPIGFLMARVEEANKVISPILDLMQTTSAFVYLIPVVMFFGIGEAPAIIATLVFALPPIIKLTNLGIREVPSDLIEAGKALGCTHFGLFRKVELPLARPTIMAGANQTIMLSLNMSVIAGLIGAGGLGAEIVRAIQMLRVGDGFVAGFCVTAIAICLDRITCGIGNR